MVMSGSCRHFVGRTFTQHCRMTFFFFSFEVSVTLNPMQVNIKGVSLYINTHEGGGMKTVL